MKHKLLWQVFTPIWIVEEILNYVGFIGDNLSNKKIIDPACWDGAFLKVIIERIVDFALLNNKSTEQIKFILEQTVYWIEIDELEYKNCLLNLDNIVQNKLKNSVQINWKIYNDNTLFKYKEFKGFFDFVVGNPPYIRIHNLDEQTRKLLKNEFMFIQWTIDIYLSFFELWFKLLNKTWKLGYITPNSYLHNSSYKGFRKYLKITKAIKIVVDFKANKIFNNFSTYTAITIINFFEDNESFVYKELIDNKIEEINQIKYKDLTDNDWSFTYKENMNFIHNLYLNTNMKIWDFYDVQYGFATLRDKIFIWKKDQENWDFVLFNWSWIEKDILYKVVKWSTYKGNKTDIQFIIFPYKKVNNKYIVIQELEMQNKYPKTYEYLLQNKEELLKRDIDKWALWYEYGRSQWVQTIHNEKIVISTLMKDNINFYELDENTFVYSGIFIIKKNKWYNWNIVKNILNSDEFIKYIKTTGKDFSWWYKSISSNQIKNYPTKEINHQKNLFNYC